MRRSFSEVDGRVRAMKQEVVAALAVAIDGWQLGDAGAMLEMSPGLAGDVRRGRVDRATLDRLVRSALTMGHDVSLVITLPDDGRARRRIVPVAGVDVPASERVSVSEPGTSPRRGA